MPEISENKNQRGILFLIMAMALTAMAAGMGWGIRGQYGHETGAMIAGVLASLTLVLLFIPNVSSLRGARCAAMMTVAIGIGGSMTYGQTVGLTHDGDLVGNAEAWRQGMMGLFIKGGLWIGFGGVFLGMGLSGKRYRPSEMLIVLLSLFVIFFLGVWLFNSPFDISKRILPQFYFSADWLFQPDKKDLKPRPEVWGGYLVAMTGLLAYVRLFRNDRLAFRMGLIGILAGGLGFSIGQCIQSYHAWYPEEFTTGKFKDFVYYTKNFNWWNMMETTFGLIWGAIMALGLWCNQKLIKVDEVEDDVTIPLSVEFFLLVIHLIFLIHSEIVYIAGANGLPGENAILLSLYIQYGFFMAIIPLVTIAGGRIWPYFMLLVVVAAPIIGKTMRELCFRQESVPVSQGWFIFAEIPMGIMVLAATILSIKSLKNQSTRAFASVSLFLTTLLYFGLNSSFFEHAWPWEEITGRTANQTIFMICGGFLILAAVINGIYSLVEKKKEA